MCNSTPGNDYLVCEPLHECCVICFWCWSIYHLILFSRCHFVWKLFPSKVCLTFEFCFCFSVQKNTQYVLVFDAFVIVICLASLILCTRSIVLALRLRKVNVCWNILPPFQTSAFSLSKQWGLDEGLSCPTWGLDWIKFLWVIVLQQGINQPGV